MSFKQSLQHHWRVFRAAWRQRNKTRSFGREQHELEFLPAALEVQETPPSPAGRAIAWLLVMLFVLAVLWAIFGKVDIVAVAQGKVIPAGKSKVIQPFEIGIVHAIHVEEGQPVEAGDSLIDLDPTDAQADAARLHAEWMNARASLARTDTFLAMLRDDADEYRPMEAVDGLDPSVLSAQQDLLFSQYQSYRARMASLNSQVRRKQSEIDSINEELKKLDAVIPLLTRRADSLRALLDQKMIPETDYLAIEQERIEAVQTRAVLKANLAETRAAYAQAQAEMDSEKAEAQRTALSERVELEVRSAGLAQELAKAEKRSGLQRITAPVDGVVQQLAVHTVGGVVTPAQSLMVVVPQDATLEVEAKVQNKDIGFVHEGQEAIVKIDAFPFTKYGVIDARVLSVSNDAIEDEKMGWVFGARLAMSSSTLPVNGRDVKLSPGMSVMIEVKTGERRLIEYFLSPVLRGANESVRER